MNYNFFADKGDKINVLDFIFQATALQVFDHYSAHEQEIRQYKSTAEIASHFELEKGGQFAVTFQLWAPDFGGQARFQRVELNPKYCKGHTYRYATEGWGLIQLYLGGQDKNILNYCHIGHFNEAGALKKEAFHENNSRVDQWDWKAIEQTSRKLKYQIHNKMAVRKIHSVGVLPGADVLIKSGVKLLGD
jgi:hypothetical protein